MLSQFELKDVLQYNPETGVFVWIKGRRWGYKAGTIDTLPSGYMQRRISIGRKLYKDSVLAWLYMTGVYPDHIVEHADGDSLNCKWGNLRAATQSQNLCNAAVRSDNSSGFKGVSLNRSGTWSAYINLKGKRMFLGNYKTAEEANDVRIAAASELHKEFAR